MSDQISTSCPEVDHALARLGAGGVFDLFLPLSRYFHATPWRRFEDSEIAAYREQFIDITQDQFTDGFSLSRLKAFLSGWASSLDIGSVGEEADDDRQKLIDQNMLACRFFGKFSQLLGEALYLGLDFIPYAESGFMSAEDFDSCYKERIARDPSLVVRASFDTLYMIYGSVDGVQKLIDESLNRIAIRETKKDLDWCKRQRSSVLIHILDWLTISVQRDAPWLKNVDDQGRSKKLMKISSIEALAAEADKQLRKLPVKREPLEKKDEEIFAQDGGPFSLVRMKTPEALDTESALMRHCVGLGAYDHKLGDEGYTLLSLRDEQGYPHATIEVRDNEVVQFLGRFNTEPLSEHKAAVARLLALPELGPRSDERELNPFWIPLEHDREYYMLELDRIRGVIPN